MMMERFPHPHERCILVWQSVRVPSCGSSKWLGSCFAKLAKGYEHSLSAHATSKSSVQDWCVVFQEASVVQHGPGPRVRHRNVSSMSNKLLGSKSSFLEAV